MTSIISVEEWKIMPERFGKIKPEKGAYSDVVVKDSVLYAEGGMIAIFYLKHDCPTLSKP